MSEPPTMDELRAMRDAANAKADERKQLSADRRRTAEQKDMLDAGLHPATRVPLLTVQNPTCLVTCGDCAHAELHGHNRTYWKCTQHVLGTSSSAASDIRKSWPACTRYEERFEDEL